MAQTVDAIELQRPNHTDADVGPVDQTLKNNMYTNDLEAPLTSAEVEDVPPNGGYAWVCCGAVFFINIFTWGPTSVSVPYASSKDAIADTLRLGQSSSPTTLRNQHSPMDRSSRTRSLADCRFLKP